MYLRSEFRAVLASSVQGKIVYVYNERCMHSAFKVSLFICTFPFRDHKVFMYCVLQSGGQHSEKWKWFCVEHDQLKWLGRHFAVTIQP
jgi:hypothetical protein